MPTQIEVYTLARKQGYASGYLQATRDRLMKLTPEQMVNAAERLNQEAREFAELIGLLRQEEEKECHD